MADENGTNNGGIATETDIFQQQKKTIDTLINVLQRGGGAQPQQVIYSSPAAEKTPKVKKPTNYLAIIAIGVIAYLIYKRWK